MLHENTHPLSQTLYAELRHIAAAQLRRERAGHALQPSALVNEAFLRLGGSAVICARGEEASHKTCA